MAGGRRKLRTVTQVAELSQSEMSSRRQEAFRRRDDLNAKSQSRTPIANGWVLGSRPLRVGFWNIHLATE